MFAKSYFAVIALLWAVGMGIVIKREYFPHVEETNTDYRSLLAGIEEKRQSQLIIYQGVFDKKKVGKVYNFILPLRNEDNERSFEIATIIDYEFSSGSSSMLDNIGILSQKESAKIDRSGLKVRFSSKVHINSRYQLDELEFKLDSELMEFSYKGKVKDEKLFITYDKEGQISVSEIALPEGTMLGNGFGLIGKLPELKKGKRFNMRWLDPITRDYKIARSRVIDENNAYKWSDQAPAVHAYRIETSFNDIKSIGWFTRNGDVLEYQVLAFLFIKEPVQKQKQ